MNSKPKKRYIICVKSNGEEVNVYHSGKTFLYRSVAESKLPKWKEATGSEPYIKEIPREKSDTERLDWILANFPPLREHLIKKAYPNFVNTWRETIDQEIELQKNA